MKKLFITLLVGSVVLCITSDVVLADDNQCGCSIPWYEFWAHCPPCGPSIPTNDSYQGSSNQSNVATQNQNSFQTQTQPQPQQTLLSRAFNFVKGLGSWGSPSPNNNNNVPTIPGFSDSSNQSNVANQTQNPFPAYTPPQSNSQPSNSGWHWPWNSQPATPPPNENPFGIVKGASATAPPMQPLPQPQTNSWHPIAQSQQSIQQKLAQMTAAQKSSLNAQTDAAFYAKYPQMAGQKIDPATNPAAAQQWIAMRNNILAGTASATVSQPVSASQPVQQQTIQQQLAQMTAAQKSSLNAQTDAAFYAKYPQMAGQKIDPATNPVAAQQWIAERNNILAANARGTSGSPTQQLSLNPITQPQQPLANTLKPIATVPPTNAPLPTIPTFSAQSGVSAPSTASRSSSYPPLPTIPQLPSSSAPQSAPPAQQQLPPQPQLPTNTPATVIASQPAHVQPAPQSSGTPIVNGHVASPQVAQQIRQNLQQNNFIQRQTVPPPPPRPQTQQAQQQSQHTQLAQQQQERQRQAQLAQQKEQERKRQVQLAQQKEQERKRQVQLAQQKEQERKRQVQLAQQKEQERKRQVQLAQRKEQERQRQAQLAQQKQQERQMKAYVKQQEAYQRWQQQEANRQWQQQQIYQQPPQQDNSAEELFYATHGGRNALTEAAWRAGAY
jgi:hypothetical protein